MMVVNDRKYHLNEFFWVKVVMLECDFIIMQSSELIMNVLNDILGGRELINL